ncbi:MAG TPA: HypC/HybG/HupF family hydrogenase formation chaperone [Proteobacteria bacterium]|nr:hydrogenase isoenzymes formation protein HypC [bacterium BMS3Abin14]HDL52432.1 HypC/HybG/HupF family hydrogenase formation chaperone [Pseudomonadota bacterium]
MCIAVPGKIISIDDVNMAIVDYGGVTKSASLDLIPEAAVGDYVLVHAGFAINRLDEEEAMETMKLFDEYMGIVKNEVP